MDLSGAMEIIFLTFSACVMVAAAAYAHHLISRHIDRPQKLLLTRALLLITGLVFGFAWAMNYPADPFLALLAFLVGLGAVHVPAAVMLFFKYGRGRARQ
jgi:uncharacterized membrane protein YoaK (UPF0700 family)